MWSVNAIEGSPSSTARARDASIDPASASHDHCVWTWLSGGSMLSMIGQPTERSQAYARPAGGASSRHPYARPGAIRRFGSVLAGTCPAVLRSAPLGDAPPGMAMILLMVLAQLYGVVQMALLGWAARTIRLRVLLLAMLGGVYAAAPVAALLEVGWTRMVAAVSGDPLFEVTSRASYTVAPFIEECVKLVPLLLLWLVVRSVRRQWGVTDFVLAGAALGAGFGLAEDLLRYADDAGRAVHLASGGWVIPAGLSAPTVPGVREALTSWLPAGVGSGGPLGDGPADAINVHLVWSCVAGLGLALALRGGWRRAWLVGLGLVALAGADHAAFNTQGIAGGLARALAAPFGAARVLIWAYPLAVLATAIWLDRRALSTPSPLPSTNPASAAAEAAARASAASASAAGGPAAGAPAGGGAGVVGSGASALVVVGGLGVRKAASRLFVVWPRRGAGRCAGAGNRADRSGAGPGWGAGGVAGLAGGGAAALQQGRSRGWPLAGGGGAADDPARAAGAAVAAAPAPAGAVPAGRRRPQFGERAAGDGDALPVLAGDRGGGRRCGLDGLEPGRGGAPPPRGPAPPGRRRARHRDPAAAGPRRLAAGLADRLLAAAPRPRAHRSPARGRPHPRRGRSGAADRRPAVGPGRGRRGPTVRLRPAGRRWWRAAVDRGQRGAGREAGRLGGRRWRRRRPDGRRRRRREQRERRGRRGARRQWRRPRRVHHGRPRAGVGPRAGAGPALHGRRAGAARRPSRRGGRARGQAHPRADPPDAHRRGGPADPGAERGPVR